MASAQDKQLETEPGRTMMESSINRVNQDLKVEADQVQVGTEIAGTGENTWKMPKGYRYVEMSNSHQIRFLLPHSPDEDIYHPRHHYKPTPPYYKPPSPSYSLTSSLCRRKSRSYKRTSPSDRPTSHDYNPTSLSSIPTPPSYRPIAAYSLASEEYQHVPPVTVIFNPTNEPGYCPASPDYSPLTSRPNKFTRASYIPTSASNSSSGMGPSSIQKGNVSSEVNRHQG